MSKYGYKIHNSLFNRSFGINMKHFTTQNSSLCSLRGKLGIQINNTVYTSKEKNSQLSSKKPSATKHSPPSNVYYLEFYSNCLFLISTQDRMSFILSNIVCNEVCSERTIAFLIAVYFPYWCIHMLRTHQQCHDI